MTPADRKQLKRLVDAKRREQIRVARGDNRHTACVGCGIDCDDATPGCLQCGDRVRKRRYREAEIDGRMQHGTEVGYSHWGCRCIECRKAAAEARKRRRRAAA